MDRIASFLEMGGYAPYVWPAYAIAFVVMVGFLLTSLRTLKSRRATLKALEAARPDRRQRRSKTKGAKAQ